MSRADAQIAPWHQRNWDARAVANFAGGGSGSGLLVAAACAGGTGTMYRAAALLAAALVAVGLLAVWFELGHPRRALNAFLHARTSWMTRESIVALALFACGVAAAWDGGGALAWLAGAVAAAFLYCQARILHAARGIPAWRSRGIVALIVATGLAEGVGILLLLVVLGGGAPLRLVALALAVLLVARAVAWRAYRARLAAPLRAVAALDAAAGAFQLVANALAALLALGAAPAPPGLASWTAAAASALAVGGGWRLKFVLVARAAFNQGFALPRLPVRGRGRPGAGVKPGW